MKYKRRLLLTSARREAVSPQSLRRPKKLLNSSERRFDKREDCWRQLRPLQQRAVEFVADHNEVALLFKQRLGKTWIAAGAIERIRPMRTLIICPLTNKDTTWRETLRRLIPHFPLSSPTRKGKKALLDCLAAFEEGIFLIHFEGCDAIIKQLCRMEWDFIIVDEAQRAKNRSSRFSRSLFKLRGVGRKLILTGTPVEDHPQDIWAQMRFLAPQVFGTRWKYFDEEYLEQPETNIPKGKGRVRIMRALLIRKMQKKKLGFKKGMLAQYLKKLKPYCWYEELPAPEPNFHIESAPLFGYQAEVYDKLKRKSVVKLRDGVRIMAPLEVTKNAKLRQVTSGFLIDEDKEVHWIGKAKQRKLINLLSRLETPVVIFCFYTEELRWIRDNLPGRVELLWGKEKDREERNRIQKRFQNGKIDYLGCQTRTGGVGIDLYRAKSLIVQSSTHSSIDFDQLISRIRLPEQTDPVDIYLIISPGTVDSERQEVIFRKTRGVRKTLSNFRR